jgi:hypothetical protein
LGDLFGVEILAVCLALCREGCETDARFFILHSRCFGIEFGEEGVSDLLSCYPLLEDENDQLCMGVA